MYQRPVAVITHPQRRDAFISSGAGYGYMNMYTSKLMLEVKFFFTSISFDIQWNPYFSNPLLLNLLIT